MFYLVKTPGWLKKLYKRYTWHINTSRKTLYLSFDDGPHPSITPFVLDELKKYNARATFFCIGKNVASHPDVYRRILNEGHAVGNHTNDHLNGWKTSDDIYMENIKQAGRIIDSTLFRPPYGRMKKTQAGKLLAVRSNVRIIMWDVLSGDFDTGISKEKCLRNVLRNSSAGAIIVFHDSEKAEERMRFALPQVLKYFSEKEYFFGKIDEEQTP